MVIEVLKNLEVKINNNSYKVTVERKGNKNTYIRVKDDLTILVTTHYLVTNKQILDLLSKNLEFIGEMVEKKNKKLAKEDKFYFLGNQYDVILVPTMDKVEITETKTFVKSKDYLEKWYRKQMLSIFEERLQEKYHLFEEKIPYPKLKVRKMKTRWGVCNRKNLSITLNTELIKMNIDKIDYVIIHELAHLVYFDHSKAFWNLVSKYCPNYKNIRKSMKEW